MHYIRETGQKQDSGRPQIRTNSSYNADKTSIFGDGKSLLLKT